MNFNLRSVYELVQRRELSVAGAEKLISDFTRESGVRVEISEESVDSSRIADRGAIAITGMAGRFPEAPDVNTFWTNLAAGRSAGTEPPLTRWGAEQRNELDTHRGCFLENVDEFDPLFFGLSGKDAEFADPQQRLFLQEAWKAFEDAGYSERTLNNSRCGVFVGVGPSDYTHRMIAEGVSPDPRAFIGNASSILASRISYILNLKGPSIAIDTACSSSLVAVHLACQSILTHESDLALAGGVFISTSAGFHVLTSMAGMLSPDGKCKAFDDSADGFVPGEAVAAVVLKRLENALADGDHIYGVVRGSGVNQDGKTNGITAPSSMSQSELERAVYDRSGIDPATVTYVETHGTGTKLGDPVEFEALTNAFRKYTDKQQYCAIGSVKTNIGHCSTAAGITGLIKVLLCLKNRQLPPSLNFERPNALIRFGGSPFYVNTRLSDWEPNGHGPRRAAVSSFGLSGTNAHLIVEQAPPRYERATASTVPYQIVAISAKTQEAFQLRVRELRQFLEGEADEDFADICYTLNTGRAHFAYRAAIIARDRHDLLSKLNALERDGRAPDCIIRLRQDMDEPDEQKIGRLESLISMLRSNSSADDNECHDRLVALADYYVSMYEIDWDVLYAGQHRWRVSLPTYPFNRERYWLPRARKSTLAQPTRDQPTSGPYYYLRHWEKKPIQANSAISVAPPHIIVFEEGSDIASELEHKISAAGLRISTIVVRPGGSYREDPAARSYTVSPTSRSDYEALLASLERRGVSKICIVHCWRLNNLPELQERERALDLGVRSIAALAQAALSQKSPATVFFLNPAVGDNSLPQDAAVSGFSASLPMLNPAMRVVTVCLESDTENSKAADVILSELLFNTSPGLDEIRHTATDRFVRAILPLNTESAPSQLPIRSAGVYLITGGCGPLGSIFAKYLARRYAGKLILTGRKQSDTTRALISEIAALGSEALFLSADVCDEPRMREVIAIVKARYGRLDGVIHAAGSLNGKPLNAKNLADFNAVLLPKIRGTLLLDSLTSDENLAFFAVFSSVASVLGDFGQCDYAVASRFLDAFAAERERLRIAGARSGKTVSIGWPLWEAGQTHFPDGGDRLYLKTTGLEYLTEAKGIEAFEYALSSREPHVLVLDGERERIEHLFNPRSPAMPAAIDKTAVSGAAKPLATGKLPASSTSEAVENRLRELFSKALRIDATRLDGDTNFSEFGVDSIAVKDLTDRLNHEFGLDLTPTVFFANSTLSKLSRYLSEHCSMPVVQQTVVSRDVEQVPINRMPPVPEHIRASDIGNKLVAVVGAGARLPQSHNLDEFWRHLVHKKDLITEVPPDRWNWQDIDRRENGQARRSVPHWGGFMDDIDKFDATFFHISPREAAFMDPQHRLVLETAWKTLEDAGYRPSSLAGRRVGVFVGAQFNEYMALIGDAGEARAQAALGSTHTMLANRVSYFLDFRGPSEVIDTACSSALIAIHRAVRSIQAGECELALAGGVSLMLSPNTVELANELGMLSSDGRCKAFDRRANGYVKGEGVGAVLLKPLDRAIADGDHIYAVIRGSAENHGGKANSLTAPNPEAQTDLLIDAYKNAGIDPGAVTYIEAHGTGTELGDPIEIAALAEAFRRLRQDNGGEPLPPATCGIGSVKTNVGHLEPAAGIASVMKVLLALRHRTLPATLHVEEVNPYLRLETTPFYLVTKTKVWNSSTPRCAGISSFGFGGSNAHVILEEHFDERQPTAAVSEEPQLILLSAKDDDRLREYSHALLSWVAAGIEHGDQIRLEDVAFTLQVGREPMEERLAIIADSFEDLQRKLDASLGAKPPERTFRGSAKPHHSGLALLDDSPEAAEFIRATVANRRLDRLAGFWVRGMEIDWSTLYPHGARRRVSLPTYPFARQRHWISRKPLAAATSRNITSDTGRRSEGDVDSQAAASRLVGMNSLSATCETSKLEPETAVATVYNDRPANLSQSVTAIKDKLRSMLAAALYMESSLIDDSTSFSELGLDSILAVELVEQLNNEFGTKFKATRLYDYSNLNELST
ncbi:MAG: SDR family NAD(P)-dependent oxidoreductase, partial [Acidobacteriaceae bacterium]|nr:SDR family NAD(P)-dependent oxidoreductase [Acidobacteriaceae bacterium]